MNPVECKDCDRTFYPPGSARHHGPWPHAWEPDTDTCPGCTGDAICDDWHCTERARTRRDEDGYVLGNYCDKCHEDYESE